MSVQETAGVAPEREIVQISVGNDARANVAWKLELTRGLGFHDFIRSFLDLNIPYEPDVTGFLVRALRPGDTFVDVGANLGWFTCLGASAVGPSGSVYAFEPGPENVRELARNVEHNGFVNVSIVDKAASQASGPIEFYLNADNSAGHAVWDPQHFPGNAPARGTISVDAVSLDDYFISRGLGIRALKIDTEGAEENVLRGAECLLQEGNIDFVVAELHTVGLHELGASQTSLREFMASVDYDCFLLNHSGRYPQQIHEGVTIESQYIVNLMFCKPTAVAQIWPRFVIDERTRQG
jgi:FkbM family methyltransferase